MRKALLTTVLTLCFLFPAQADNPKELPRKDYSELSRLIHHVVVKEIPKEFEDRIGWGQMVPLTERLRFPNLPRTRVRIGDKEGYANGLWKKYKVRIDNPDKDLKIVVKELSRLDAKTYRLVVDAEVSFTGEGEVQNWLKGVALGKVNALADAVLELGMVFDVGVTFNTKRFPPELNIEPKLADLKINLKEFNLRRVSNPTTNLALEGETAKNLGDDWRESLNTLIKNFEPEIQRRANEAIGQSLREGKGNISAAKLFQADPPAKPKEK